MVNRDKIIKYCENFLKVDEFEDVFHNGLQIEGVEEIDKIVTGVTFSVELVEEAINRKAQMILVHHGVSSFNFGDKFRVMGHFKKRLELILKNNINLVGFHLPLDAHNEIGNNALICQFLGIEKRKKFDDGKHGEIGFVGQLSDAMKIHKFMKLVDEKLQTKASLIATNKTKEVKRVVVVSGGAGDDVKIAHQLGADTFITGEIREHNYWEARELGINLIVAGHYNSERLGVKTLGEQLAEKFKVEVQFVDINCPV